MNWFLDMFGLRKFIEPDELENWRREGMPMEDAEKDLRTSLMPANVDYEEAIRHVLLCHHAERLPPTDLFLSWQAICPQADFARLLELSGLVVAAISAEINRKASGKAGETNADGFLNVDVANA